MVENIKNAVKSFESSKEFKRFKKVNPKSYLVSCFTMVQGPESCPWQVSYYHPESHKITSFVLKDKAESCGKDEILQKEKVAVEKLELSKVKVSLERALKGIEDYRKEHHPNDYPGKLIIVLQSLDGKTLWNITDITATLKIWNVKLDAEDGSMIEETMQNLLSFKAK